MIFVNLPRAMQRARLAGDTVGVITGADASHLATFRFPVYFACFSCRWEHEFTLRAQKPRQKSRAPNT
jgi:hypothetical protein